MSDEIKSAFEKAMEKVERMNLAPPTEEERLSWEAAPKGRKIAAAYLKGEETLNSAIAEADAKERPYMIEGAVEVLTASIQLPKHEAAERETARRRESVRGLSNPAYFRPLWVRRASSSPTATKCRSTLRAGCTLSAMPCGVNGT